MLSEELSNQSYDALLELNPIEGFGLITKYTFYKFIRSIYTNDDALRSTDFPILCSLIQLSLNTLIEEQGATSFGIGDEELKMVLERSIGDSNLSHDSKSCFQSEGVHSSNSATLNPIFDNMHDNELVQVLQEHWHNFACAYSEYNNYLDVHREGYTSTEGIRLFEKVKYYDKLSTDSKNALRKRGHPIVNEF